jgi:hypothetical protein
MEATNPWTAFVDSTKENLNQFSSFVEESKKRLLQSGEESKSFWLNQIEFDKQQLAEETQQLRKFQQKEESWEKDHAIAKRQKIPH